MLTHYLDELVDSSQNILLLQGPIGPFFYEFGQWLVKHQKKVFKINLNAGDERFYSNKTANTFAYRASLEGFAKYLTQFCQKNQIDNIVCFGDNRKYHRIAKEIATQHNIRFWAFEEGYFRPEYITLEKTGVNAFSPIPKSADYFLQYADLPDPPTPEKVAKGFCPMAKWAIQYYTSGYYCRSRYPEYRHHRILNVLYYIKLWVVSGIKRLHYYIHDHSFAKKVTQGKLGEFFIVPLQVYDDSQVTVHSDYNSVGDFLREVLDSFVAHAPRRFNLVVKHHPMDRGFIDYGKVIKEYEQRYPQLRERIFYIHDVPMPVFLRHAQGMVTLNSTSGISALLHHMPVKTLGRASYDMEGLTHQGSLDEFWVNPTAPNPEVFEAYRKYHLYKTHLNGSFYNKVILRYPYNAFEG